MTPKHAPLIPLSLLFGRSQRLSPTLSPDGTSIAFLSTADGALNVWFDSVPLEECRLITRETGRGVQSVSWGPTSSHIIYSKDPTGAENLQLVSVDLRTGEERPLVPFMDAQTRLLAVNPRFPNEVLVESNPEDPARFDVFRVSLSTAEVEKIAVNPGFAEWLVDEHLSVRGGLRYRSDGSSELMFGDGPTSCWRALLSMEPEDSITSFPVGFDRSGDNVFVVSSCGAETGRLLRLNVRTGESTVVAADPHYDVTEVLLSRGTQEPQLVGFQRERPEYWPLNSAVEEDLSAIQGDGRCRATIEGQDATGRLWLVSLSADTEPKSYLTFDRKTRHLTPLFRDRLNLAGYTLARTEPFSFVARDGLRIHGYITLPPAAPRRRLATVLLVHGGPWTRDRWGFNPEVQWLANRGYVCLQVNFRGSTGYGKRFLDAGDREWGGKMQNDLMDAVHWALDVGYADPARLAILGWSYGGYAALLGASHEPSLFRCAVALAPVVSLPLFLTSAPPYWGPRYLSVLRRRIGDPERDREKLLARSPISRADRIHIPVLLAYGENDGRIQVEPLKRLTNLLRGSSTKHQFMTFGGEGHGIVQPENRIVLYTAVESFLAEHLHGR